MSKSNKTGYSLAVFVVLVCAAELARAEVVTHNFTGTVTSVTGTPCSLSPNVGDSLQGSITYDTSLPPAFDTGTVAGYNQLSPSGMSVVIAGVTLQSAGTAQFQVVNDAPSGFTVGSPCGFINGPLDNINGFFNVGCGSMGFSLTDFTQMVFSTTNPLPTSLDFSSFSQRDGCIFAGGSRIKFSVDPPARDADGDGVPDDEDDCPDSNLSPTVVIDECNSGVPNTLFPSGCTISDRITECEDGASNHGQFMNCVSNLTGVLKADGVITGPQKDAIQRCAAQADIP